MMLHGVCNSDVPCPHLPPSVFHGHPQPPPTLHSAIPTLDHAVALLMCRSLGWGLRWITLWPKDCPIFSDGNSAYCSMPLSDWPPSRRCRLLDRPLKRYASERDKDKVERRPAAPVCRYVAGAGSRGCATPDGGGGFHKGEIWWVNFSSPMSLSYNLLVGGFGLANGATVITIIKKS